MTKDFDKWNKVKKNINNKNINRELFYHEREVWWCNLGVNIGVEADGKHEIFERPVLIIKVFNSEMIWSLPLTSKEKIGKYYKKVNYENGFSFVNLSQIKVVSTKRLNRKIGFIQKEDFIKVLDELQNILETSKPACAGFSEA
jgi:mRNA interferase MazF